MGGGRPRGASRRRRSIASICPATGPASTREQSRTRRPSSGGVAGVRAPVDDRRRPPRVAPRRSSGRSSGRRGVRVGVPLVERADHRADHAVVDQSGLEFERVALGDRGRHRRAVGGAAEACDHAVRVMRGSCSGSGGGARSGSGRHRTGRPTPGPVARRPRHGSCRTSAGAPGRARDAVARRLRAAPTWSAAAIE